MEKRLLCIVLIVETFFFGMEPDVQRILGEVDLAGLVDLIFEDRAPINLHSRVSHVDNFVDLLSQDYEH